MGSEIAYDNVQTGSLVDSRVSTIATAGLLDSRCVLGGKREGKGRECNEVGVGPRTVASGGEMVE
jgi:hypothetical protein